MRRLFADTLYWVALANPSDQWHDAAMMLATQMGDATIYTTEEVLTETLTALAGGGTKRRRDVVAMVQAVMAAPNVIVQHQSHDTFLEGLDFYSRRSDKAYSLTDCVSMNACRSAGISDVLTNDHHFTQEGFTVLVAR